MVPALAEQLSALARLQPADPTAALVAALRAGPPADATRPDDGHGCRTYGDGSTEALSERRLLAHYLRPSGRGAAATSCGAPAAAMCLSLQLGTANATAAGAAAGAEALNVRQQGLCSGAGSVVMTPRESFSLTPRLTGRRTARCGGGAAEGGTARPVGDGNGLVKVEVFCVSRSLGIFLHEKKWRGLYLN